MPGPKPLLGERTLMLKLSVLAGFLVAAGSVYAGLKVSYPVFVYRYPDGTGSAYGTLSDTRASADTVAYVGCNSNGYQGQRNGGCQARDASSTYGSCWTADPSILAAIEALDSDSTVSFSWDPYGQCTLVQAITTSWTAPKQP